MCLLARLQWLALTIAVVTSRPLLAQDLAPRAYVVTPVHSNAVTLTWAFYDGGLNFSGAIPVTATGTYNVPIFTYYHSLSFFGRSANVTASLPYGAGNFEAAALGKQRLAYRSGLLDGYGGAWFYTENSAEFHLPHPAPQTEEPIGSFEGHLSRDFGRGTWASVDGNFWFGGVTTLDGIRNPATRQTSSRLGGTAAFRVSGHQSVKVSYSGGTYIRFGGNYQNVSLAWQYSWLGRP